MLKIYLLYFAYYDRKSGVTWYAKAGREGMTITDFSNAIFKTTGHRAADGEILPIYHMKDFHKLVNKRPLSLAYSEPPCYNRTEVVFMPVLSMFFGIIVRMYKEAGGKHNLPHIHAEYAGEEVVVALNGQILEGQIPKTKMKLLDAWMEIHRDDLEADWKLLSDGEQFFRIDPLR